MTRKQGERSLRRDILNKILMIYEGYGNHAKKLCDGALDSKTRKELIQATDYEKKTLLQLIVEIGFKLFLKKKEEEAIKTGDKTRIDEFSKSVKNLPSTIRERYRERIVSYYHSINKEETGVGFLHNQKTSSTSSKKFSLLFKEFLSQEKYWLLTMVQNYDLDHTFPELVNTQEQTEKLYRARRRLTGEDRYRCVVLENRTRKLLSCYSDHMLGVTGEKYENQKFISYQGLKLAALLEKLGLKKAEDYRMYFCGVSTAKKRAKNYRPQVLSLQIQQSPKSLFDFISYLRNHWYERHAYRPEEEKEFKSSDFSHDYYWENANGAVNLADMFLQDRTNGESRLEMEVPSALSDMEWFVYYCWCSPNIRKLVRLGLIKQYDPGLHDKLLGLVKEAKKNSNLRNALLAAKKLIDDMYKKAGVPLRHKQDYKNLRDWLRFDDKTQINVKEWLSAHQDR